jgi:hypothetical protein
MIIALHQSFGYVGKLNQIFIQLYFYRGCVFFELVNQSGIITKQYALNLAVIDRKTQFFFQHAIVRFVYNLIGSVDNQEMIVIG